MFDRFVQMELIKHFKIQLIVTGLSGVIFAAEEAAPPNNIEASFSSVTGEVSQVLALDASGLRLALSTDNDILSADAPEWAKKLISDVEEIKRTQRRILTDLQLNDSLQSVSLSRDRRRSSDSLYGGNPRAEGAFQATPPQHKLFEGRVSFSEIPLENSSVFGSSREMTTEESTAFFALHNNLEESIADLKKEYKHLRTKKKNSDSISDKEYAQGVTQRAEFKKKEIDLNSSFILDCFDILDAKRAIAIPEIKKNFRKQILAKRNKTVKEK